MCTEDQSVNNSYREVQLRFPFLHYFLFLFPESPYNLFPFLLPSCLFTYLFLSPSNARLLKCKSGCFRKALSVDKEVMPPWFLLTQISCVLLTGLGGWMLTQPTHLEPLQWFQHLWKLSSLPFASFSQFWNNPSNSYVHLSSLFFFPEPF